MYECFSGIAVSIKNHELGVSMKNSNIKTTFFGKSICLLVYVFSCYPKGTGRISPYHPYFLLIAMKQIFFASMQWDSTYRSCGVVELIYFTLQIAVPVVESTSS